MSRLWTMIILASILGLTSCSTEESDSSKIQVEIFPENPIVYDVDFTGPDQDGDGTPDTIKAPWFMIRVRISNSHSSKPITLIGINYLIADASGELKSKFIKAPLSGTSLGTLKSPGASDFTDGDNIYETGVIYVGGLDANNNGFTYQGAVELMGWFGTDDVQAGRLSVSESFTTE